MREFNWQNYSFFEGLLGSLQPGHVIPPDVGLLHHDGTCRTKTEPSTWSLTHLGVPATPTSHHHGPQAAYPSAALAISFSLDYLLHCHYRCWERRQKTTGWSDRQLARRLRERGQALMASPVLSRHFPCSTVVERSARKAPQGCRGCTSSAILSRSSRKHSPHAPSLLHEGQRTEMCALS